METLVALPWNRWSAWSGIRSHPLQTGQVHPPGNADVAGVEQGVRVAPRPQQILPKAIGHSSLIADVVVGKFVDALPLYRQEKIFAREGIELSRQTMAGWMIALDENSGL